MFYRLNPTNEFQCKILQITYLIKITAIVDDPHVNAFVTIPITIGSFPLLFKESTPPIPTNNSCNSSSDIRNEFSKWNNNTKNKNAQTLYNEVIKLNEL